MTGARRPCFDCRHRIEAAPPDMTRRAGPVLSGDREDRIADAQSLADRRISERAAVQAGEAFPAEPWFEDWCSYWSTQSPGNFRRNVVNGEIFQAAFELCAVHNSSGQCPKYSPRASR